MFAFGLALIFGGAVLVMIVKLIIDIDSNDTQSKHVSKPTDIDRWQLSSELRADLLDAKYGLTDWATRVNERISELELDKESVITWGNTFPGTNKRTVKRKYTKRKKD